MSKTGGGTEVDSSVQVVPIPPGWWYGYSRGWKQTRQLYKPTKFSVHLGVFWWQCCCFWNSGNLPEKDRWVFCLLHEFFLIDWTTLVRGISEGQKQRLDKIKEAILKFISAGLDQQYSPKDPIRAWLSFVKRSDEAPGIHKKLLAEVSTLGEKPQLYSVNTWLGPMNYDPSRPYDLGVEEIVGEGNFSDFDITNGLIPEVPVLRERRPSTEGSTVAPTPPFRNDGSHLQPTRPQPPRPHPNFQNAGGNLQHIQNAVARLGHEQASWQQRLNAMSQRGVNHVSESMFQDMAVGINHEVSMAWNNQSGDPRMNPMANIALNQNINMGKGQNAMVSPEQNTHGGKGKVYQGFENNNDMNGRYMTGQPMKGTNGLGMPPLVQEPFSARPFSHVPSSNESASQSSSSSAFRVQSQKTNPSRTENRPKTGGISFGNTPPTPPAKKPRMALAFSP